MIKVMLITNCMQSLILFRLSLLVTLREKGLEVIACAPDPDAKAIAQLEKHGIRFVEIKLAKAGLNPFIDLYSSFVLYKIFRRERPDIILNYTLKPVVYGSLMGYCAGIPKIFSVITGLGSVFIENDKKINFVRFIAKILYRIALRVNDKVFVLNPDILQYFVTNGILQKERSVLINGEGLDIEYYSVMHLPVVNYPTFLMAARLIKDKGIYEYVNAARSIKNKYPSVRFLLIGCVDANPSSLKQSEVDEIVNEKIVEFPGWLDDVRPVIADSSVFVLPSYAEGVPRSTMEAMSMGRPIITTDAPGCRETVIDGVNGFLVPIKNIEKLAEAMEKFILHPELISKMGKESRRIVEEKYDVRKINQVILKAMEII